MVFVLFLSCSEHPYTLKGEDETSRMYLIDTIQKLRRAKSITEKPLIVLNGHPFTYEDFNNNRIELYRSDIIEIQGVFRKNNQGGAEAIYGENAEEGVILLKVRKFKLDGKKLY